LKLGLQCRLCFTDIEVAGIHPFLGTFAKPFVFLVFEAESVFMRSDEVPLAIFRNAEVFWVFWIGKNCFDRDTCLAPEVAAASATSRNKMLTDWREKQAAKQIPCRAALTSAS
jgi:hypothetical protein